MGKVLRTFPINYPKSIMGISRGFRGKVKYFALSHRNYGKSQRAPVYMKKRGRVMGIIGKWGG
jgi:hypothetical protein